jgi:hypothetical protein
MSLGICSSRPRHAHAARAAFRSVSAVILCAGSALVGGQAAMAQSTELGIVPYAIGGDSDPAPGYQLTMLLWTQPQVLAQPQGPINGFQAFLDYDVNQFTFREDLSSYTESVFDAHIRPMNLAEVAAGYLHLDGTTFMPGGPNATSNYEVLATLVFDVHQCHLNPDSIFFSTYGPFASELSYFGVPQSTVTVPTPAGIVDQIPPTPACLADVSLPASPGGNGAVYYPIIDPPLNDNFDSVCLSQYISASRSDGNGWESGAPFAIGTTQLTWDIMDCCGNVTTCVQNLTVEPYAQLQVTIELPGSGPCVRCVRIAGHDCNIPQSVGFAEAEIEFVDHDGDPLTPVRFSGTVPLAVGNWSSVNIKDPQHTKWGSGSAITNLPSIAVASETIVLQPGDNDDDGDVDINDLTWLVSTFGEPSSPSCSPAIARDSDFSNDGFILTDDYSLLSAQWLTFSQLGSCTAPSVSEPVADPAAPGEEAKPKETPDSKLDRRTRIATSELEPERRRADLNGDGNFDWRDVQRFEKSRGLPAKLSERLRTGT